MQQKIIHVQPYNTDDKTTNATENEEQDNSTVNEIEAQEKTIGDVPDVNKILTGRVFF